DILLEDKKSKAQYFIELKSVTLVENGVARFPDAPTKRGTRHLLTLKSLVKEGKKAGVVFIIQRGDAVSFRANNETDPLFAETLAEVHKAGVEVYAYRCDVQKDDIHISKRIEVTL
ncbi:MAG: DNA/RNA nuclease SfsA, partial [Halanaerobiales bacterium]